MADAPKLSVTRRELVEAAPAVQAISTFTIPQIRAVAALATLKRKAAGYLEDIEAARKALCEKHVMRDAKGEPQYLPDKSYDMGTNLAAFQAEWLALLAEPITLTNCRAIKMSEFEGATQLVRKEKEAPPEILRGIPPDLLFALGPLVIDDLSDAGPAVPEPTASASK